jgi:ElaB/YqjD/DUF883 family membrane-anchored ribosome-binding protein
MNQSDITKERLFEEFNAVIGETEVLLKSIAGASGEKAGAMRASVEKSLAAAGDRVAKLREESVAQAHAAAEATDEYVHDNPWRAVGMVAAVAGITGLVAGLLIARR